MSWMSWMSWMSRMPRPVMHVPRGRSMRRRASRRSLLPSTRCAAPARSLLPSPRTTGSMRGSSGNLYVRVRVTSVATAMTTTAMAPAAAPTTPEAVVP
jgi:hypothetical protein